MYLFRHHSDLVCINVCHQKKSLLDFSFLSAKAQYHDRVVSKLIIKARYRAKAMEYVFTSIGLCVYLSVCLSVTTITKKDCGRICTKFYVKVPTGKWKTQVHVSLQSVEECGCNNQKNSANRRLFTK